MKIAVIPQDSVLARLDSLVQIAMAVQLATLEIPVIVVYQAMITMDTLIVVQLLTPVQQEDQILQLYLDSLKENVITYKRVLDAPFNKQKTFVKLCLDLELGVKYLNPLHYKLIMMY